MPGRQAHGRSLLGKPKTDKGRKPKSKASSRKTALDAFALAAKEIPAKSGIRGPRTRDLDFEPNQGKRYRGDDDGEGDEDEDEEESSRRNKRMRNSKGDGKDGGREDEDEDYDEFNSDSEGNEWRVGVGEDDDSEIDSDEAFGESDEDRFDGYAFRGSKSSSKKKKSAAQDEAEGEDDEDDEGDSNDDEGETLGEDAIDLAQALDEASDEDDEGSSGDTESGSEEDSVDNSGSGSDDESATSDVDEDEDEDSDEASPSKFSALQSLVANFAGGNGDEDNTAAAAATGAKAKIGLKDLGLFGVKDPNIKKSLKLMHKEEKAAMANGATKKSGGKSQKLDVPLARRQQAKLDRTVAAEQAHKTLDRWQDTVKHNRRAEHLVFPLPDTLPDAGLDKGGELPPLDLKKATEGGKGTELEQTILSIMEESGLGPSSNAAKGASIKDGGAGGDEEEMQQISRADLKDLWTRRRRERERQSREQARAARIKKIKSKAYRRVHRRERQANAQELEGVGEGHDSEEEREAAHRRRALERVGAKHRDSKWARSAKKAGLAAWDEGVRAGLTEMARRDEELRRRVEGRSLGGGGGGSDDDDDDDAEAASESDEDAADRRRLLRELDEAAAAADGAPESNLMKMKFMQRAEAARRQANDALVAQLRKELDSNGEEGDDDDNDEGPAEVGRRSYGVRGAADAKKATDGGRTPKARKAKAGAVVAEAGSAEADAVQKVLAGSGRARQGKPLETALSLGSSDQASGAAGSWSRAGAGASDSQWEVAGKKKKRSKESSGPDDAVVDINEFVTAGPPPRAAASAAAKNNKTKTKAEAETADAGPSSTGGGGGDSDSETEAALHLPLAIRDQQLADRAFADDELVARDFEREKAEVADEDDDKVVDNTLPGWGSWGGEGVSSRQNKMSRGRGRFLTKVEGVKKKSDRRDAKLERVIINEKRVRKNDKYLASQLPHVFENKDQYERSLRLPVGPEWTTKQTFQDATKPRILMKGGIIAPMAKPKAR